MVWRGLVRLRGASLVALLAELLLDGGPLMAAHRACSATTDSASAVDGLEGTGTSFGPTQALFQECAGEPEANGITPASDPSQPALFYLMVAGFGLAGGAFLSRRLSAARYGLRH